MVPVDADSRLGTDCDSEIEAHGLDSEFETDCDSNTDALSEADSELETDCDSEIESTTDADSGFEDCDSDTDALWRWLTIETDCDPEADVLRRSADSLNDAELDESDSLAEGNEAWSWVRETKFNSWNNRRNWSTKGLRLAFKCRSTQWVAYSMILTSRVRHLLLCDSLNDADSLTEMDSLTDADSEFDSRLWFRHWHTLLTLILN